VVSRHWSWVLNTCLLCSVQGLKISPHTIHIDMFCYFPNFLQAVAAIIPWPCSMQFIFTSQLQLEVYMRSKFSATVYGTAATCCGCTQSWVNSKFSATVYGTAATCCGCTQSWVNSKFSATVYGTAATCCGCTQSWVNSKFMKLVAEDLWWWTCGAKLWWNLSSEDTRRVQISHGHPPPLSLSLSLSRIYSHPTIWCTTTCLCLVSLSSLEMNIVLICHCIYLCRYIFCNCLCTEIIYS